MEALRCPGSGVALGVKALHLCWVAISGIRALAGALFETKGYALIATEA